MTQTHTTWADVFLFLGITQHFFAATVCLSWTHSAFVFSGLPYTQRHIWGMPPAFRANLLHHLPAQPGHRDHLLRRGLHRLRRPKQTNHHHACPNYNFMGAGGEGEGEEPKPALRWLVWAPSPGVWLAGCQVAGFLGFSGCSFFWLSIQ